MTLSEAIERVEHISQACHSHRVFRNGDGQTLPVIVMQPEDEEALRLVLVAARQAQQCDDCDCVLRYETDTH